MKCWGCKADKPKDQFDKNPALCRTCVGGTVVPRSTKRGRSRGSGGGFADAVGDFVEGIIDAITGN
ncbi:hypothetical protein SEA_DAUBENSKI_147 [Streptomyces phage Daubenski]|uniref:Uncharacterized protein n=1 Tax=Streptomyces phage Daubenski TaxID=2653725 RepID=A0A5Q2WIR5_9CAUD|nr:hypothetical protein KNU80_gp137 [Streptomyces phage Daubenski]QGH76435.1 hypothetical protein SEA_DAUBENSKI_147 [Streptomyces phage Daubenski]